MCDTMVLRNDTRIVFGKNSDRDPGEPQLIQYCSGSEGLAQATHPERLVKYDTRQFLRLQEASQGFTSPYNALISRPAWMWGAEMGVNECGVAIGNEAVFSTSPVQKDGLLGMDILRLVLHNAESGNQAVQMIIDLIERFGQGGDASYKGHLSYHNSFLVQDSSEAFILETAGFHWAVKKISSIGSISNAYTIGCDYDDADPLTQHRHHHFTRRHASALHLLFTQGHVRQRQSAEKLSSTTPTWQGIRNILICSKTTRNKPDKSMRSICMDSQGLIKSQTTASLIVESEGGMCLAWMTGAPAPNLNPFYPLSLSKKAFNSEDFSNSMASYAFALYKIEQTNKIKRSSIEVQTKIATWARELEDAFENLVRKPFKLQDVKALDEACAECRRLGKIHDARVDSLLAR